MHFGFGQTMLGILLTVEVTAFTGHILKVIGTRTKKEMFWIDASTNIAAVKNK